MVERNFKLKIKAESFNFKDTVFSHGWVFLKPFYWDENSSELRLKIKIGRPKTVGITIRQINESLEITVQVFGSLLSVRDKNEIKKTVRHIFRLDEDLSGFYDICRKDPKLKFVSKTKSGRLLRSPTVFEDIIKTICTTNCSWSNTKMMVSNLCDLEDGCFPYPETILKTGINKLQRNCRVGYRAKPIYDFAKEVFHGGFNPELLLLEKNVDQIKKTLISFNGIGKYSVNHILMLLGNYSEIPVDSEVASYICGLYFKGQKKSEKEISNLFEKYGEWKFLAYKFQRIGRKLNYIN